jgi:hypothetical protein
LSGRDGYMRCGDPQLDHVAGFVPGNQTGRSGSQSAKESRMPGLAADQRASRPPRFRHPGDPVGGFCQWVLLALARLPAQPPANFKPELLGNENRRECAARPQGEAQTYRAELALHYGLGMPPRAGHRPSLRENLRSAEFGLRARRNFSQPRPTALLSFLPVQGCTAGKVNSIAEIIVGNRSNLSPIAVGAVYNKIRNNEENPFPMVSSHAVNRKQHGRGAEAAAPG